MKGHLIVIFVGLALLMGIALFVLTEVETPASRDLTGRDTSTHESIPIIQNVPKDAIPPLSYPRYVEINQAPWLADSDIVLGVEFQKDARAYPIKILNFHEIINETIGGEDVVVTYCPLCRSGIIFDRHLDNKTLTFGNTGALYENGLVMYDLQTESYWYQVGGRAIKGDLLGRKLRVLPSFLTTWKEWKRLNPATKVLSNNTGYSHDYDRDPNIGYDAPNSAPAFPVSISDDRLPPKEKVLGIEVNGVEKAYVVSRVKGVAVHDEIAGQLIEIVGDAGGISARAFFISGSTRTPAPSVATYWFAWYAAHPNTELYK